MWHLSYLRKKDIHLVRHCVKNYGTFVPTYFRSQERKYHRWNFRSLELLLPGAKVTRNFRSLYQYEKRITVAPSTKE